MTSYDLYIGGLEDAGDKARIEENGISVIVSLTRGVPSNGYPLRTYVVDYPMVDDSDVDRLTFREAVDHLAIFLLEGESVLVHSLNGTSRCAAVAAAAVSILEEISFDEALKIVRDSADYVDPHPGLVESGRQTVHELKYIAN